MIDLSTAADDDILARTIAGEARNQGADGMQAVASVVLNRVAKPGWWGTTVKEVCLKPFQFSAWNLNDPNRAVILNLDDSFAIYREALDIAQQVIAGKLADNTNGATMYQVIGTNAYWSRGHTPCAIIGAHEFYTDV